MDESQYDVQHHRVRYELPRLDEAELLTDPIAIFAAWLAGASAAGVIEPNAMVLATAGADARPRARTVLLREFDETGFVFFTNYASTKGHQLAENPWASLCFTWLPIHRQVIVEGPVHKLDAETCDRYFASRPAESQIASALSPQSQVIDSIEPLLAELVQTHQQHPDGVPRPVHWGGYRVMPEMIEMWQGNLGRLHDRFRFSRSDERGWRRERLAP